jgi:hypothetical protein
MGAREPYRQSPSQNYTATQSSECPPPHELEYSIHTDFPTR